MIELPHLPSLWPLTLLLLFPFSHPCFWKMCMPRLFFNSLFGLSYKQNKIWYRYDDSSQHPWHGTLGQGHLWRMRMYPEASTGPRAWAWEHAVHSTFAPHQSWQKCPPLGVCPFLFSLLFAVKKDAWLPIDVAIWKVCAKHNWFFSKQEVWLEWFREPITLSSQMPCHSTKTWWIKCSPWSHIP